MANGMRYDSVHNLEGPSTPSTYLPFLVFLTIFKTIFFLGGNLFWTKKQQQDNNFRVVDIGTFEEEKVIYFIFFCFF